MSPPSPLHDEIVRFAAKMTPLPEEHQRCEKLIEVLRKIAYETYGRDVELSPFGSYSNGLAARHSDLDIVITGLLKPDTPEGFFGHKQVLVWELLEKLEQQILVCPALHVVNVQFVRHAKVPILKVALEDQVMMDISINDETCMRAASFVLEKVRRNPALRPLCLVLKAILKAHHLGEVRDGGLGGYSLTNMVMAHVQETLKAGRSLHDFGDLLVSFFLRFGHQFDAEKQAVSVRKGGIVSKSYVTSDAYRSRPMRPMGASRRLAMRWFIENPITGRDVAQGSYKVYLIKDLFTAAYATLKSAKKESTDKIFPALFDLKFGNNNNNTI